MSLNPALSKRTVLGWWCFVRIEVKSTWASRLCYGFGALWVLASDGNVRATLFLWRFVFKMRECAVQGLLWGQWEGVWGKGAASWYSCASRKENSALGAVGGSLCPQGHCWPQRGFLDSLCCGLAKVSALSTEPENQNEQKLLKISLSGSVAFPQQLVVPASRGGMEAEMWQWGAGCPEPCAVGQEGGNSTYRFPSSLALLLLGHICCCLEKILLYPCSIGI